MGYAPLHHYFQVHYCTIIGHRLLYRVHWSIGGKCSYCIFNFQGSLAARRTCNPRRALLIQYLLFAPVFLQAVCLSLTCVIKNVSKRIVCSEGKGRKESIKYKARVPAAGAAPAVAAKMSLLCSRPSIVDRRPSTVDVPVYCV